MKPSEDRKVVRTVTRAARAYATAVLKLEDVEMRITRWGYTGYAYLIITGTDPVEGGRVGLELEVSPHGFIHDSGQRVVIPEEGS